ncbi:hypothetical protein GGTG_07508 [Gaeumannomyces tritici R3-111a-1]|uniref:Alpha/beta hydrolase fold-3 domain-containing protein n=1 Tax=Gaeumannomyces tritici (strain R3-111a-1) TaxID=644352 RepID=J3P1W0_GAET3|nr:hypothetical protein GGTG_07508 [Gaeumannomyces tritici R3-111a-1]EJT73652.1 hypothetical protein GGTG_07508 [Gaeumannomyces tritici R3-111a-1]
MTAKTTAALRVDPEWAAVLDQIGSGPQPNFTSVWDVREAVNTQLGPIVAALPRHDGMLQTKHQVTSLDGTVIDVYRFLPKALQANDTTTPAAADLGRAVVMNFGGGYVAGSAPSWAPAMADLAERAGTQVFAPEYRIAPEHPAPAGVEDAFSTVAWLQLPQSAAAFGVDPARIVVGGMSAGGGIAAGAALLARDRGLSPPIAASLLRYPMLDDRTRLDDADPLHPYLLWTQRQNELAWPAYLAGSDSVRYGAPGRTEDVAGLPDTYVGVGSLDLFKAENVDYAARLAKADNNVELQLYSGIAHGFDLAVPGIRLSREMNANEVRFIRRF